MDTDKQVDYHSLLRDSFARVMRPDSEADIVEVLKVLRKSFLHGAASFDQMVKAMEANGMSEPELLADGILSMKLLGSMLLHFGTGGSRSMLLDATN